MSGFWIRTTSTSMEKSFRVGIGIFSCDILKVEALNNKEFITELSSRLGYTLKDTSELVSSLLSSMSRQWQEGNAVSIQGFGTFEVKKKTERISVNPVTRQRMLIPPKLTLTYRPSSSLKDKFK